MWNSVCRFECVEWEKGDECVFMREKEEGEILIPVIWQIGTQGDELHAGKGDAESLSIGESLQEASFQTEGIDRRDVGKK